VSGPLSSNGIMGVSILSQLKNQLVVIAINIGRISFFMLLFFVLTLFNVSGIAC